MKTIRELNLEIPTADVLWSDYQREKSVHRVAALYGIAGETVRARLRKAGYATVRHSAGQLGDTSWSAVEIQRLRAWYTEHPFASSLALQELADGLGRLKSNVCRKARELGLTQQKRKKTEHVKGRKPPKFTDDSERRRHQGQCIKRYIETNGHPRGALGMKHTAETRRKLSTTSRAAWANPDSKLNSPVLQQIRSDNAMRNSRLGLFGPRSSNPYSRTKSGTRDDLGMFFRSSWEANYARYLRFLKQRGEIRDWKYESQTFWFEAIKRGVRSYTPDFKVVSVNGDHEWHEVKGWMDAKSATRLKRMAKYYPDERVVVIDAPWFKQANRTLKGLIANWE